MTNINSVKCTPLLLANPFFLMWGYIISVFFPGVIHSYFVFRFYFHLNEAQKYKHLLKHTYTICYT